jgi:hypothetical protein
LIRVAKLFLCVIVRDSEIFCLHILCISCGVTVLYLSLRGYNSTKQLSTSVLSWVVPRNQTVTRSSHGYFIRAAQLATHRDLCRQVTMYNWTAGYQHLAMDAGNGRRWCELVGSLPGKGQCVYIYNYITLYIYNTYIILYDLIWWFLFNRQRWTENVKGSFQIFPDTLLRIFLSACGCKNKFMQYHQNGKKIWSSNRQPLPSL